MRPWPAIAIFYFKEDYEQVDTRGRESKMIIDEELALQSRKARPRVEYGETYDYALLQLTSFRQLPAFMPLV